jgi:hypothetical protein
MRRVGDVGEERRIFWVADRDETDAELFDATDLGIDVDGLPGARDGFGQLGAGTSWWRKPPGPSWFRRPPSACTAAHFSIVGNRVPAKGGGDGILLDGQGNGNVLTLAGNTVSSDSGGDAMALLLSSTATMSVTITNNTLSTAGLATGLTLDRGSHCRVRGVGCHRQHLARSGVHHLSRLAREQGFDAGMLGRHGKPSTGNEGLMVFRLFPAPKPPVTKKKRRE